MPVGPYDAIIVTAGAWDIASAWLEALSPDDGALVVPLRMNGVTRSIGFRRSGDHLASTSAQTCGFVPVQGTTAYSERTFVLPMPAGGQALLRFEDNAPDRIPVTSDILAGEPAEAWSGITTANMVSFADLFLWCSGFLPGFCRISTGDDTLPGVRRRPDGPGRYPCACVHEDSLAYLASRPIDDGIGEFGARAHGPNATAAAELLTDHIRQWTAHGRDLPADAFAYWPTGTCQGPPLGKTAVFSKTHGSVTITWPSDQAASHQNDGGTVTSSLT